MDKPEGIAAILEEDGLLDLETREAVLQEHRETGIGLLALLKRDHLLDDEQMLHLVARHNGMDFVNLAPEDVEPMTAHLVSYEVASRHQLIPFRREEQRLLVAMAAPMNLVIRDEIAMKTGYEVVPVAATPAAIRQAIHVHFDVANITKQTIATMCLQDDTSGGRRASDETLERDVLSERVAQDPIRKLVASVIRGAIDARASDIHIEPQPSEIRIRYRVDGLLRNAVTVPLSARQEVVSHIKILSDMDISEKRIPQDGHLALQHCGRPYDLRVSSLPAMDGEKLVIRILDKSANRWDLDAVVHSPEDRAAFQSLLRNPYGMVLVTGPTGSGKTTTLYSLLQQVNAPERNIVTVEDPVEYRLDGITQVQVRPQAGMTFAAALRSILRQDPDIILIGEIRDLETAEIAVSAALTGHLVLSTLHTNDAVGAISRLINLGVPPFLVGSALLGTVAQRLIRTLCPKCRQRVRADRETLRTLYGETPPPRARKSVWRAPGCSDCFGSGFKGRRSIYEILAVSRPLRQLILAGESDQVLQAQAVQEGMRCLRDSALQEVLAGTTDLNEVSRVVELVGR